MLIIEQIIKTIILIINKHNKILMTLWVYKVIKIKIKINLILWCRVINKL